MHLIVLFAIFGLAWGLRYTWTENDRLTWMARWNLTRFSFPSGRYANGEATPTRFILPPLLLFTTSISIATMGPHGRMVWIGNDWFSYNLAIGWLVLAGLYLLKLIYAGWRLLQQVRTYPTIELGGKQVRILNLPTPYIAQIGFWQPELVITQFILDNLSPEHLAAVLAHEQAHYRYRDTWCFFWLGWMREITAWLPQTEAMWQELLLLRELRADRWASKQTDPLLVAEALLLVVQNTPIFTEDFCTAFSQSLPVNRLNQRIEALLEIAQTNDTATKKRSQIDLRSWIYLLIGFLPLLVIFFHN